MIKHIYTVRYHKFFDNYLQDVSTAFTTYEAAEAKALDILNSLIKVANREMDYIKSNPATYDITTDDIKDKVDDVYTTIKQYALFGLTAGRYIKSISFYNYARYIDYTQRIYRLKPIDHDSNHPNGYWTTTIYIKHYTVDID